MRYLLRGFFCSLRVRVSITLNLFLSNTNSNDRFSEPRGIYSKRNTVTLTNRQTTLSDLNLTIMRWRKINLEWSSHPVSRIMGVMEIMLFSTLLQHQRHLIHIRTIIMCRRNKDSSNWIGGTFLLGKSYHCNSYSSDWFQNFRNTSHLSGLDYCKRHKTEFSRPPRLHIAWIILI